MILTLLLDLDGVLITTPPWKRDAIHVDGYSDFNPDCVENLNHLLSLIECEIWLSSSRRVAKTLEEWNQLFKNRGVKSSISGRLPVLEGASRKEEIEHFIVKRRTKDFMILDDDKSLNELPFAWKEKLVLTEYLKGLDERALVHARLILEKF